MERATGLTARFLNELPFLHRPGLHWHRSCNLYETNTKIGFPGWPEHNLDCVPVLGGQLNRGGLHRPPFLFSEPCVYINRFRIAATKVPLQARFRSPLSGE